ncbi:predicted protein [Postia placenta Mad-698-R]|uniref:C2H2-type domain-containing protein n=1 Tax=Postia placenta MAD-698-R-SB12 TaxID=670580 RepID=A0A1X6N0Z4_9APHY|nr:hypothetical protein POSPLADRAFT_1143296 [Postia placenta MAD-698-R-SB12]EED80385.1 predicted protein [Postia placenta Mad-698-R]OSX62123.1 hypothetical protein POSPLADRAFT_1143296 [Postia placenta MAD-698-R-SB12]
MSYNPTTSFTTYPLDGPIDASGVTLLFGQAMRLDSASPSQAEQSVGSFSTSWTGASSYTDVMRSSSDMYTYWYSDIDSGYDGMLFASKHASEHAMAAAECLLSPPIDPTLIAHPRSYEIASALDNSAHAANSPGTLSSVSTCSDATLSGYTPSPSPYATTSSWCSDDEATCSLSTRDPSSASTSRKNRSVYYHLSRPSSSSLTSTSSPSTSQTRRSKARRSPIRVRRRNVQIGLGAAVPEPRATHVPKLVQCTVEGCGKVLTKGAMRRHKKTHRKQEKWRCCGIPVEMAFGLSSDRRMTGGCAKVFSRKDALERHLKNPNNPCIGDVERAELLGWFRDAKLLAGLNVDEQLAAQILVAMQGVARRLPSSGTMAGNSRLAALNDTITVDVLSTIVKIPSRPAGRKITPRQEGTRRSQRLLEKEKVAPVPSNERQREDASGSKSDSKAEMGQSVLQPSNGSVGGEWQPTASEEKPIPTEKTKRKRDENEENLIQRGPAKVERT